MGIQIRLTKPLPAVAAAETYLPAAQIGAALNSRQIHKKAIPGSPQCPTPPPLLPKAKSRRRKAAHGSAIATCDGGKKARWSLWISSGRSLWRGASDASNTAGRRLDLAPALREQIQLVRQAPGLGSKGSASAKEWQAQSWKGPKDTAPAPRLRGGTAMALRQADNQPSADAQFPASHQARRRRSFSSRYGRRLPEGKKYNAQQNANRCLPPGGNTGCRRSR